MASSQQQQQPQQQQQQPSQPPPLPSQDSNSGSNPVLVLVSLNNTFERKFIELPYYPHVLKLGRQTGSKTIAAPQNGYFDTRVMSRQHAEVWAAPTTGRVFVKDVRSVNGTYINGHRLSPEGTESEPFEIRPDDVLGFGIDIQDDETHAIKHHKILAAVERIVFGNSMMPHPVHLSLHDMDPANNIQNPASHAASSTLSRPGILGPHGNSNTTAAPVKQLLKDSNNTTLGPDHKNINNTKQHHKHKQHSKSTAGTTTTNSKITLDMIINKLGDELAIVQSQTVELDLANATVTHLRHKLQWQSDKLESAHENLRHRAGRIKDLESRLELERQAKELALESAMILRAKLSARLENDQENQNDDDDDIDHQDKEKIHHARRKSDSFDTPDIDHLEPPGQTPLPPAIATWSDKEEYNDDDVVPASPQLLTSPLPLDTNIEGSSPVTPRNETSIIDDGDGDRIRLLEQELERYKRRMSELEYESRARLITIEDLRRHHHLTTQQVNSSTSPVQQAPHRHHDHNHHHNHPFITAIGIVFFGVGCMAVINTFLDKK